MTAHRSVRRTSALRGMALGAALVVAAAPLFAAPPVEAPGRSPAPTAAPRPLLVGTLVTDVDPATVVPPLRVGPLPSFDADATGHVYIVAVYDRAVVGAAPFDQRVRLRLPGGHLYQERVRPVDPAARRDALVDRPDLAGHPVRVARSRGARLGSGRAARPALVTSEILPVSGSWVTRHGLYGTWTAEVVVERDGRVLATSTTRFELREGSR